MKKTALLLMLFTGISSSISAQYNVLPQDYDWSETTLIHDDTIQLKNPNTAMWISVGSTIGTYVLFAGLSSTESESVALYSILSLSVLAAPALGYLYTNNWNDFWSSVSRRFMGRLVMGTGAIIVLLESFDNWFGDDDADDLIIAGGLALMLAGGIYNLSIVFKDFRQVRTRVHEYNEGLVQSVQIAPAIDPVNKALGVGIRVNF